jgi:hypothetical protein
MKIEKENSRIETAYNRRKNSLSKRSQEEMVGFVLIVVLIVLAGLVFLGISLRNPVETSKSPEIQNFLEASMISTTDCAINFVPQYESLEDLIKSCYENQKCLNGKTSCEELNLTITKILENSWNTGEESRYSGYYMGVYYSSNSSEEIQNIMSIEKGTCNTGKSGAEKLISSYPGTITVRMEVCYKN